MPYPAIISSAIEVASPAGEFNFKLVVPSLKQDTDYVTQFNGIIPLSSGSSPNPTISITLPYPKLRFALIKASAPIELSFTSVASQDQWIPLPFRILQLQLSPLDNFPITHFKARAAQITNAPPSPISVEILLGGASS